ncbi:hypothetical protein BLOT_006608 [Blomia tropicalis]|nr:hypothetical protein BLOT_006608 [Blomia tropicalis]
MMAKLHVKLRSIGIQLRYNIKSGYVSHKKSPLNTKTANVHSIGHDCKLSFSSLSVGDRRRARRRRLSTHYRLKLMNESIDKVDRTKANACMIAISMERLLPSASHKEIDYKTSETKRNEFNVKVLYQLDGARPNQFSQTTTTTNNNIRKKNMCAGNVNAPFVSGSQDATRLKTTRSF